MVKKLPPAETEEAKLKLLIIKKYAGISLRECKNNLIAEIGETVYRRNRWIP